MFTSARTRTAAALGAGAAALGVGYKSYFRNVGTVNCEERKIALSPKEFRDFVLVEKHAVTHNTNRYRFALPTNEHISGLVTASCLVAKTTKDGKDVIRPYTPVTLNEQQGFFDLIVKTYPAPGGIMSRHIDSLEIGDSLAMKGPFVKIPYKKNMKRKIGMVAGGTGITPMLQVIKEVLKDPKDRTEISLIFANVTEKDIILRNELDALAYLHPNFKVYYTLDKPPTKGWPMGKGFVSKEMLQTHIPPPSEDVLVMTCGPKGFMDHVSGDKLPDKSQGEVSGLLKELGYTKDQVFKF